jgi:hypothetical protein
MERRWLNHRYFPTLARPQSYRVTKVSGPRASTPHTARGGKREFAVKTIQPSTAHAAPNRRDFVAGTVAIGSLAALPGCARGDTDRYAAAAARIRAPLGIDPGPRDFVRYATLAPNGHNTQPWRFVEEGSRVTIYPDFGRRTPVVDPDDHHLFVSLGCAAENLSIAAGAHGRPTAIAFDPRGGGRIAVDLTTGASSDGDLCRAIPRRQSTRSLFDGREVAVDDLRQLERAATIAGVSLILILARPRLETILEQVIAGNNRQLDDPAFVSELRHWVRFNPQDALQQADGLYSACTGNRTVPTWLGRRAFSLFFTKKTEDERYAAQLRSSSGVAVFVGDKADPDHWVRVGRSFQRFALQATALGLRQALINQPIEVPSVRGPFARWLGIGDVRPDLVVRFGAAPAMPMSIRRTPVSV